MWSFTPHPVSCAREAQTSRRPSFKATLEWTTQNVCARLTSDAIKYSKSLLSWFFVLAVFEWSDGKQRFELSMRETAQKKQWRINSLEMTTRFCLQNSEVGCMVNRWTRYVLLNDQRSLAFLKIFKKWEMDQNWRSPEMFHFSLHFNNYLQITSIVLKIVNDPTELQSSLRTTSSRERNIKIRSMRVIAGIHTKILA